MNLYKTEIPEIVMTPYKMERTCIGTETIPEDVVNLYKTETIGVVVLNLYKVETITGVAENLYKTEAIPEVIMALYKNGNNSRRRSGPMIRVDDNFYRDNVE